MIVIDIVAKLKKGLKTKEHYEFKTELEYDYWFESYIINKDPNVISYDVEIRFFI